MIYKIMDKIIRFIFSSAVFFILITSSSCDHKKRTEFISIAIACVPPTVNVGTTSQCTATGTYKNNLTKDITTLVTWSSSDATVATIASTGLATGKTAGTTMITATFESIASNIITFTISGNNLAPSLSYNDNTGNTYPLLAASVDGGVTWSYKITSSSSTGGTLNMPDDASTTEQSAFLYPGGCNGSVCTASGNYYNGTGTFPLLAASVDGGVTWSYKITSSASTGGNLNMPNDAASDPSALLYPGGCNGSVCTASGNYYNGTGYFPLLAVSVDGGVTWSYKITSSASTGGNLNMPSDTATDPSASLYPGGCNGSVCTASGSYNNSAGTFPLLAASVDGGVTWSYKITSSSLTGGTLNMPNDAAPNPEADLCIFNSNNDPYLNTLFCNG